MASTGNCQRRRLAERGAFNVELCDCGALHVTVYFLTLRLDPGAYRELFYVLDEGLRAIEARATVGRPIVH